MESATERYEDLPKEGLISIIVEQQHERGNNGPASCSSFSYSSACRGLVLLLLKGKLSREEGFSNDCPVSISGDRGSLASSLDNAITKDQNWLAGMFGTDSQGVSYIRHLVSRQNSGRKAPGPVVIYLNCSLDINILLEDQHVKEPRLLRALIASIERQAHDRKETDKTYSLIRECSSGAGPSQSDLGERGPSNNFQDLVFSSFFSADNVFLEHNQNLAQAVVMHMDSKARSLRTQGLRAVVDELLRNLHTNNRGGKKRFVCTNTTIETLGLRSWSTLQPLRNLVRGTRQAIKAGCKFEVWRVFLLNKPLCIANSKELPTFYSTLAENRDIGVKVAVVSTPRLCSGDLSYQLADYYCVPGKCCFVSSAGSYLLSRFAKDSMMSEPIITKYSELAESMVDQALVGDGARVWTGGSLEDLKAMLSEL